MTQIVPYMYFLVLGESIFAEIAYIFVIILNLHSIFRVYANLKKRKISISKMLILHCFAWTIVGSFTLIHNSYLLALWKPDDIPYDPFTFYHTGMTYFSLVPLPAMAIFGLSIECCFMFVIQNKSSLKKIQHFLLAIAILGIIAATSFMLQASFAYAPDPFPQFIPSLSPSGMSVEEVAETRRWHFRIIFCSLNFIAAIILSIFIQRPKIVKQTNIQRFTISTTRKLLVIKVGIDVAVFGIEFVVSKAAGYSAVNILGSYARAFSAMDALLSSIIFAKALKNLAKKITFKSQTSTITFTERINPVVSK